MIESKLYSFITLAKEGSYTKTAKVLSLTQPAITQHIKSIEDEFNVKLFHKNGRTLTLTKEGEMLLRYCYRLDSLNTMMHQAIDDYKKNLIRLNIGVSTTASEFLIPTIIKELYDDKKTTLNIHIHPIKELYERLDSYEFDFIIVDELLNNEADYYTFKIYDDKLVFIAAPNNPLCEEKKIELYNLRKIPLILRNAKSTTINQFSSYLTLKNDNIENFNVVLEIESLQIIKELVSINYGISVLPLKACLNEINSEKIKVLDVKDFDVERTTYIVCRKDSDMLNITKSFVQLIKRQNF